jgi:predicted NAD-dependent protein-ADP-ribosyltransferase YbiA (DUF1768 family)
MLRSVSSVDDLVSLVASGVRVKYLFFWGHRPSADGRVTASCLSQWWPAPFTVDGERFDRVWGIGLAADDERAGDPYLWQGLNLLGFALMRAREELSASP